MKYNLKAIMLRAWKNYHKNTDLSFSECLHKAWISEKTKEINKKRVAISNKLQYIFSKILSILKV